MVIFFFLFPGLQFACQSCRPLLLHRPAQAVPLPPVPYLPAPPAKEKSQINKMSYIDASSLPTQCSLVGTQAHPIDPYDRPFLPMARA